MIVFHIISNIMKYMDILRGRLCMPMKSKQIIYVIMSIFLLSCITVISVFAYGNGRAENVNADGIKVEIINDEKTDKPGFIVETFDIDPIALQKIQSNDSNKITIEVGEIILNDPEPVKNNFQIKLGTPILTKNTPVNLIWSE